jgi:hypothetical protein
LALAGAILVAGVAAFLWHPAGSDDSDADSDGADKSRHVVFHIKHKAEPPKLGIEYYFDGNAIVDSRFVGEHLLALSASGNVLSFNRETFAVRDQKVLRRRATCLGPADNTHMLAGISNGAIVRVAAEDLALEQIAVVPGVPRWIGKRSKDGALVVAYQTSQSAEDILVKDEGQGRTYEVGARPIFFLDSADRLWVASAGKLEVIDLASGASKEVVFGGRLDSVRGFVELSDRQVWGFGGAERSGEMSSFVVRLAPGAKPVVIYPPAGKRRTGDDAWPTTPITHILEAADPARVLVVSDNGVSVSDKTLASWKPLDALAAGRRDDDAIHAIGQAHLATSGILVTLARGGFLEVTPDYTRRHLLDGQNTVTRPTEIVRLADGIAFYGDGGPLFYSKGGWHPLPDPVVPPAELMGPARPGEKERLWAAMTTIPIEGEISYVIAKAGPPRHYSGHVHGLRDVFLTARWDGKVLTVLGREELPIEPDDTFATPDKQLWNVDDQGLWSFSGGHWHLVMRSTPENGDGSKPAGAADSAGSRERGTFKSAIGEPLHFAEGFAPPFYGLPVAAASWALVRLDSNEAGGVPLIDEVPVKLDGRRLQIRDATIWGNTKDELLLATDRGLCVFNVRWGTCELIRPEGLGDEVNLFMHDGTKRLWLGGRGLWVLRDQKHADAVHPSVPMLADSEVVALAEAPDGRLVIGLKGRGAVFLTIPQGWFQRPPDPSATLATWEATQAHEPAFQDRGIVLRPCRGKNGQFTDGITGALLADLRALVGSLGPRVRIELEETFEGKPDIAVRGAEPEKLLEGVLPLLGKPGSKAKVSVLKRFGPRGSAAVEVKSCPAM